MVTVVKVNDKKNSAVKSENWDMNYRDAEAKVKELNKKVKYPYRWTIATVYGG